MKQDTVEAYAEHSKINDKNYFYISHHQVAINSPVAVVWPHLINLGSWMVDFEMAHVAGPRAQEGEIVRLYSGQDFLMQTTKMITNQLIVAENLPSTFEQEYSTGVGIFVLTERFDQTVVTVTMSRHYAFLGEGDNPMRAFRESEAFIEKTRAMWEDRFLAKLKELSES